jgi:hypothetical protein
MKFELITKKYKDSPNPAVHITYDFFLNEVKEKDVKEFLAFADQFKGKN